MNNTEVINFRLPVGTLVTVENLDRPVAIIGHEIWIESEERRFNYMGIQYPVGYISEGDFAFFNKAQIIDILNLRFLHLEHVALSDLLDREFKTGIYSELKDQLDEVVAGENEYLEL